MAQGNTVRDQAGEEAQSLAAARRASEDHMVEKPVVDLAGYVEFEPTAGKASADHMVEKTIVDLAGYAEKEVAVKQTPEGCMMEKLLEAVVKKMLDFVVVGRKAAEVG